MIYKIFAYFFHFLRSDVLLKTVVYFIFFLVLFFYLFFPRVLWLLPITGILVCKFSPFLFFSLSSYWRVSSFSSSSKEKFPGEKQTSELRNLFIIWRAATQPCEGYFFFPSLSLKNFIGSVANRANREPG